jgi:hypothetical protein
MTKNGSDKTTLASGIASLLLSGHRKRRRIFGGAFLVHRIIPTLTISPSFLVALTTLGDQAKQAICRDPSALPSNSHQSDKAQQPTDFLR